MTLSKGALIHSDAKLKKAIDTRKSAKGRRQAAQNSWDVHRRNVPVSVSKPPWEEKVLEKEGTPTVFKIQLDMSGRNLLVYNRDKSIFHQIDDPKVSTFIAKLLELEPMGKRYAEGRIGADGEFRIDKVLDIVGDW